jgi:triacylglycerol lipase
MMQNLLRVVSLAVALAWLALLLPWLATGRAGPGWPFWLAVVSLHPAALGLQFILQARLAGADPAPAATAAQRWRAWANEWWFSTQVFGYWQAWRVNAQADHLPQTPGQRGVVLVHGFSCNRGLWRDWMPALQRQGIAHVAVTLEPAFGSIDDYAAPIEAAVARVQAATGCAPVLVGHSMGGLAIRAWLRAAPGALQRCHHVVTLGTPHHGTWLARFGHTRNGRQMRQQSEWLQALAAAEPAGLYGRFTCLHLPRCAHVDMVRAPAALRAVLEVRAAHPPAGRTA